MKRGAVVLLVCLLAPGTRAAQPDDAQELGRRYPAGSIASIDQADRALQDAAAVHGRLQAEYEARRRVCADVFFVTHCMAAALATERAGEQTVRRVTLESHDLRRREDARAQREHRAAELAKQDEAERLRPQREREAMAAARARAESAVAREQDALRTQESALRNQADSASRVQTQAAQQARKEQERPGQESAAEQAYRKKQADAAAYAQTRAQDRKANEQRRAERQAEREAQIRADEQQARAAAARRQSDSAAPH